MASKLKTQPDNLSYLSPSGFSFIINKLPNVNYFCQGVTLPGISINAVPVATAFTNIPFPGDRVEFQDLLIRFIIDEEMNNYQEIYNWMRGLGFPESHEEYVEVQKSDPKNPGPDSGIVSDAELLVLTGGKTPQIKFSFKDAFPLQLSSVNFDTNVEDIQYLQADVTFAYRSYTIENLLNK